MVDCQSSDLLMSSFNSESKESNHGSIHGLLVSSNPSSKPSSRTNSISTSSTTYNNFINFSVLYSIIHGTVAACLAFSTAELGSNIGSASGFALYSSYCLASLILAKPCLRRYGAKNTLLIGQFGLIVYIASFFMALLIPVTAYSVFVFGSCLGGIGAGLLWTAQGSYYSMSSSLYAVLSSNKPYIVQVNYASIFSSALLSLETLFGVAATSIYLAAQGSNVWRPVVFGLYSFLAITALYLFWQQVDPMTPTSDTRISRDDLDDHRSTSTLSEKEKFASLQSELLAVGRAIISSRPLQLLIPYQLTFGLSLGMMNYYVNSFIVKEYIGDGYIGILAALTSFTAALCAYPYATLGNHPYYGKWTVMMFSGVCFFVNAVLIMIFSNQQLGSWLVMVPYFMLHGAGRGAWESTNKAVIAEYFPHQQHRDVAYATVYFFNGLAGAFSFIFYNIFSRDTVAAINTCFPFFAMACYHMSHIITRDDHLPGGVELEQVHDVTSEIHTHTVMV